VDKFSAEASKLFKENLLRNIKRTGELSIISSIADEPVNDPTIIKDIAFQLKGEIDDLFLVIGALVDGKPYLAVAISDKLVREKKLHAGEIVKSAAKEFDGGGGGQPFFANAGGKNAGKLNQAMEKALALALFTQ
jgi:alanyl-tRNA synthetase